MSLSGARYIEDVNEVSAPRISFDCINAESFQDPVVIINGLTKGFR